ncbi:GNAT family N-acetyltransferase [Paenibacillus nanensis]|uniref:GNAT family N-acetyltransferase n=1 Tax=Paenibacillus nanensis TaxID=393251 RepID=A0A3A1UVQ6_9BACL|nr:GNAT family N-acetyltransferase [Paenibacillus nanensis]RIX51262.1 GNAT family N-acetyltransferase [Paenibacillus nanensis]
MTFHLRPLRLPEDYAPLAELLNTHWAEPTSAEKLEDDDKKLYETGHTWKNEQGLLLGYDRSRVVAVNGQNDLWGYVWVWRAPWTEPGYVCMTLVVKPEVRKQGVGEALLRHAYDWADGIGASAFITEVWDDQPEALEFAKNRGFMVERQTYQSVLQLEPSASGLTVGDPEGLLQENGLKMLTLADEPSEENERKLYELSTATMRDIPGYLGDVPDFTEWKKWYLQVDGFKPELVFIAADDGRFVGMANVIHIAATNGMYHEYTCVDRAYRGRKIALALKQAAIREGLSRGAAYIRTDNDSMNAPMLHINRKLGYKPLRGNYRIIASMEKMKELLDSINI